MERKLTAIVAADISGYSRLMGQDEAGTLALLQNRFAAIINPRISQHHGRMVKTTGDGFLAEFSSAVHAVQFAVDMQRDMALANASLPGNERMEFRIGINLGDVMCDDGDLFGDGVNVAARLEGLADAGGICIAASIHDQVRGKLKLDCDELGPRALKNIAEPVNAYRLRLTEESARSITSLSSRPRTMKPSIAVLPFVNIGGDPGGRAKYVQSLASIEQPLDTISVFWPTHLHTVGSQVQSLSHPPSPTMPH
jgi:class 3 adenylate cyclase